MLCFPLRGLEASGMGSFSMARPPDLRTAMLFVMFEDGIS